MSHLHTAFSIISIFKKLGKIDFHKFCAVFSKIPTKPWIFYQSNKKILILLHFCCFFCCIFFGGEFGTAGKMRGILKKAEILAKQLGIGSPDCLLPL